MEKYAMLRERAVEEGLFGDEDLQVPSAATDQEILTVHTRHYVEGVVTGGLTRSEQRRIGFPWSTALVERSRRSVGGTIAGARQALSDGIAANLAGGTHHAFADSGEGYCVFNDCAIAVRVLQKEASVSCALIVDCDVHQGNGTASIFASDRSVTTFSMHGANNYPFRKQRSDVDIGLADQTGDEEYLDALTRNLDRIISDQPFDLAFYVSGADPFEGDRLGRLSLTKAGLAERDRSVFRALRSASIPVVVVMAGGYASNVEDTVDIHLGTLRAASAA